MSAPSDARITAGLAEMPAQVDVLVVGLGVTGAGVAVDAAARGLSVLAVDAHDVAFGTSRWSSKLVHGGLRYLASGQVGIAYESAVERGILLQRTAPHLVRPMPMLVPLTDNVSTSHAMLTATGIHAGDLLRMAARTSAARAAVGPGAAPRGAARRAAVLGWPAGGRRAPGHLPGPDRSGARRGRADAGAGHRRDRHRRLAAR
jgi:glycerol-3-phosphate dehydrogenase